MQTNDVSDHAVPKYAAMDAARDFAAMLALPIAAVYIFERAQVGDRAVLNPLKVLGVAWALIYFPGVLAALFRRKAAWLSESMCSLALLAAAPVLGYAMRGGREWIPMGWLLAVLGGVLFLARISSWWRLTSWRFKAIMLVVAGMAGAHLVGSVYGEFYINPLFVEGMIYGEGHTDTVYLMAQMQMAKNYAVSSSGLHGTPFLAYHTGSYWFLGYFGELLNIDVVEIVNLFYPVAFLPLFIKALLSAAATCAGGAGRAMRAGGWFWFAVACVTLYLLAMHDRTAMVASDPYPGPAHTLAMFLCFEATAVAVEWWRRKDRRGAGLVDVIACFVITAVGLAVDSWFKISSGTMLLCVLGYLFLRMKLYRNWRWWPAMLGCAVIFKIELPWLLAPNYSSDFENKHRLIPLLRAFVPPTLWLEYYLFRLVPVVALGALQIHNLGLASVREVLGAVWDSRLLKTELALMTYVVSQGPNTFMDIGFGAGENFVNASYWFQATLLLSEALTLRPIAGLGDEAVNASWRDWSVKKAGVVFGVLVLGSVWLFNLAYDLKNVIYQDMFSRGIRPEVSTSLANTSFYKSGPDAERVRGERKKMLAALHGLDALPLQEKRATALYVPKSNTLYWKMLSGGRRPTAIAFVAPALSGLVCIDGVPEPTDEYKIEAYSFELYKERNITSAKQTPAENKAAVLNAAKKFGYAKVLVFDQDANGNFARDEWAVD